MPRLSLIALSLTAVLVLGASQSAWADPDLTVRSANQVLHEVMAIPASQIPGSLLAEAQGLAIIPNVLKIGFVAGFRRGHGVVMVRDANNNWTLPQFITLTGGSIGWQAGVQGTDVVLVFMTKKSVEGLLRGKFTIGADAAAAAGPVGRNAAAATDFRLKAEILSYSRSRGLFAGLALDGSAIEINPIAQTTYYGAGPGQAPMQIPESATRLVAEVTALTSGAAAGAATTAAAGTVPTTTTPTSLNVTTAASTNTREALARSATQLHTSLDESWRTYLALPTEVFEGVGPPPANSLTKALQQYDRVALDPKYQGLATRCDFQTTYQLLREYVREIAPPVETPLPPPPVR